jgi:photosystem II stability/assembly factor-like uncharacterized protein
MKAKFEKRYRAPFQWDLKRLESYGSDICWAIGAGQLIKTEDMGRTWTNLYKSPPLYRRTVPHRIVFHSRAEGLLLVHKDPEMIYFRTENGGRDWCQAHRLPKGIWGELFASRRSKKAWGLIKAGGQPAFVEIINGEGSQWNRVDTAISGEPCDMAFVTDLNGWILERWNENSWIDGSPKVERTVSVLHHTSDGGKTWSIISKMEYSVARLIAISASKLFVAGEDGIFVSEDSGVHWRQVLCKPRVPVLDLHFLGTVGAAIGTEGHIQSNMDVLMMSSRDGGETWRETNLPAAEAFLGIRLMTWSSGILASCNSIYTFDLA